MTRRAPRVTIIERLTGAVLFALIIAIAAAWIVPAAWDALAVEHVGMGR